MKHTHKNNAGFTLIELVVAMAMAVIVTAAATSVLLMGLRVNRQTADTASQQMTVRALLSVVEKTAADGNIQDVIAGYDASWQLVNAPVSEGATDYRVIFGFDPENQCIYTSREVVNGDIKEGSEGTAVLTGVYASNVTIEGDLLTVTVETKEGVFSTSVYCRVTNLKDDHTSDKLPGDNADESTLSGRELFIHKLKSQYRSRGEIRDKSGNDTGKYYSEWYIDRDYNDNIDDDGWNKKTPWCACYVSWALVQAGMSGPMGNPETTADDHPRWFANVDDFMSYFQNNGWESSAANGGVYEPRPGDLIFFDWNKGIDPEHVGVVLEVKNNGGATIVYTIEGNSSSRVAIRSYSINDPRIIGYGVIWPN